MIPQPPYTNTAMWEDVMAREKLNEQIENKIIRLHLSLHYNRTETAWGKWNVERKIEMEIVQRKKFKIYLQKAFRLHTHTLIHPIFYVMSFPQHTQIHSHTVMH